MRFRRSAGRPARSSSRSSSASRMRRPWFHRARCAGAIRPTCDERIVRRLRMERPRRAGAARPVAEPAHFDDGRLERRRGGAQAPGPRASRWRGRRRRPHRRASGRRETDARARAATSARAGLTSTSSTSQPGHPAGQPATRQPTVPPPTTATRSPTCGRASHSPLTAVSRFAASTARRRRHVIRHDVTRPAPARRSASDADTARRPCRPRSAAGPSSTPPTLAVAVLDRRREVARLKRRAHARHTRSAGRGRGTPAPRCRG